mgnify:CR=1 FL=1
MPNCGTCTACCTAFQIDWLEKPAHTPCIHCDNGCKIHDDLHYECSSFNCSYIQSGVDNENLRPDQCGIIFELLKDDVFLATVIKDSEITDVAKRQMQDFKDQGYRVMINGNL